MREEHVPGGGRSFHGVAVRGGNQLLVGLVFLALGVLFTLDNLDLIDSGPILNWWPIIVVAIGLSRLVGTRARSNMIGGALIAAAGLGLLLSNLGLIHVHVWQLWPLALIFAGIAVLTGSRQARWSSNLGGNSEDTVSALVVMGSVTRKLTSTRFRGGDATAFLGGVELDMRNVQAAEETVVIHVLVWWGGIEMFVPPDWRVSGEVTPLMAGYVDNTKVQPVGRTHLIVRGLAVMGGVEVKN